MVAFPGHRPPDRDRGFAPDQIWEWVRELAETVTLILDGATNTKSTVTLTANAASTTITDQKIGPYTTILLVPRTINAAAAASTTYLSSVTKGSAVITHASNAQTDRTFDTVLFDG